ncbi:MAG: four helix bundle protein [Patescibacteria group bacterium]
MGESGYKGLLSYRLAQISFDLTWEFVPLYYNRIEDSRQRDQMKQASRSHKQNIVEGSSERSTSTKLKLYDVAKASAMELLEDYEDILRHERLSRWLKNDPRLFKLRRTIEFSPNPSIPSFPSISSVLSSLGLEGTRGIRRGDGSREIESIVNYLVDLIVRGGYLLDRQINAVEDLHQRVGGYSENLLKKRLAYRRGTQ